jgi:hypothetical protein
MPTPSALPTATPSPTPAPTPTPMFTVCPQILIHMFLIYPAPGSTGIPDAIGPLVIGGGASKIVLHPATGPDVVSTTVVPVPSPIPSPNVSAPGSYAQALSVPPLAPATTYLVTSTQITACGTPDTQTLGSFTTQ